MAAYTTLTRERFHLLHVSFVLNKTEQVSLKVFVNHNNRNKFWMVHSLSNDPVIWEDHFPTEVMEEVIHHVKYEIACRTRDETWQTEVPKTNLVSSLTTSSHKNLCMFVFAKTGGEAHERFRYFFEYRPELRFQFWTSNPVSNDLGTPGQAIDLDVEQIHAAKANAMSYLAEQFERRSRLRERREREKQLGIGDQIVAVQAAAVERPAEEVM